jgi:nitrogen fixation NifU-like protein
VCSSDLPVKIHCSILAEDAIKAAVSDYRSRQVGQTGQPVEPAVQQAIEQPICAPAPQTA